MEEIEKLSPEEFKKYLEKQREDFDKELEKKRKLHDKEKAKIVLARLKNRESNGRKSIH